ncbi:MAG TPA: DUF1566 domain-containing protein [Bdellovibrionales bacterium]|nr:DUF1566 domain-containing protein [Bdellovibrionales bacterium]
MLRHLCFASTFAILSSSTAFGACSSPAGVTGSLQYITNDFLYCDGSAWQSATVSNTGATCSGGGELTKSGSDFQFCNGTNWISVSGPSTGSTCSTIGSFTWRSAALQMEWCDGTNWRRMGTIPADPCSGKSIGQTCVATTALYAGDLDGSKYMVTPSGCTDSSTPTCSGGTDTITKDWYGTTGSDSDIAALTNVGVATTPAPQKGDVETPIIAAYASVSADSAADFCNDMVYGGYSDWYLPSKTELAHLYCKSTPSSHSTSNPQENVNCGGSPPTAQLSGFHVGYYWSSTEYDDRFAWSQSFTNGSQYGPGGKGTTRPVRCVRRY